MRTNPNTSHPDRRRKTSDASDRRRSRYKLKDVLKRYLKPPKNLDFPPAGKEVL